MNEEVLIYNIRCLSWYANKMGINRNKLVHKELL